MSETEHDFASNFDYVMVFPMDKGSDGKYTQTAKSKAVVHAIIAKNIQTFSYLSVQGDELIVLLRCDADKLQRFTDKIDYELELDPAKAQELLEAGNPAKQISPVTINGDKKFSPVPVYSYLYGKYDNNVNQDLYRRHPAQGNRVFKESIRLKMLYYILEAPNRLGGCNISLSDLFREKQLLALYPLHHLVHGQRLKTQLTSLFSTPWSIPFELVKEYFGEKIGLYYCFLGNYTKFLLYPSFVGFLCQLVVWGTNDYSSPVLPFFAVFMCIWSIVMLEYWKREEQLIAMRWGMLKFEQTEPDRPEFHGETIESFIDGSPMMYFPKASYKRRIQFSFFIIMTMVLLVVGVVASIYVIRFALQSGPTAPYASLVASVLNTVQITVFNMIYNNVASRLTDYENHRTDTEYEDSMIVKLFAFQFINSYASFFFLAFIASHLQAPETDDDTTAKNTGQCGAPTCMTPLSINLAIIFGTKITVTNAIEVLTPYMAWKSKMKKETEGVDASKLSRPERDYMLMPFDIMAESISSYADTAIQYGFMTLFITALPIACMFSAVSCWAKVKVNGWKMLTFYQRPAPLGAQDIGSWQAIFTLISVVSVVTNAAIVCFTMDVLKEYTYLGRTWIFIGMQWAMISFQFALGAAIPDIPEEVEIQQKRNEFINSKLILFVEDEDYGQEEDDVGLNERLSVLHSKDTKGKKRKSIAINHPEVSVQPFPLTKPAGGWPGFSQSAADNRV